MTAGEGAWTDMGERLWDVAVVGAGPAGAMVALELSRRGCAVLLLERQRFPRWKVCGACLNGAAQAALAHAGLGGLVSGILGGVVGSGVTQRRLGRVRCGGRDVPAAREDGIGGRWYS